MGGCFSPAVFIGRDGTERLVFSAYYKRSFTLYVADAKKPYRKLAGSEPRALAGRARVDRAVPALDRGLDRPGEDPEEAEPQAHPRGRADSWRASASDQTFLSNTFLVFGDNLGDRRFVASLQSVSSFTDFRFQYTDLSRRLQKGIQAYDSRYYFLAFNNSTGEIVRTRSPYRFTGGDIFVSYPFSRQYRLEGNVGFLSRKYDGYPVWVDTDRGVRDHQHSDVEQLPDRRSDPRRRHDGVPVLRADLGPQAEVERDLFAPHRRDAASRRGRLDARLRHELSTSGTT